MPATVTRIQEPDRITLLSFVGDIDSADIETLDGAFNEPSGMGRGKMIADLAETTFLDSMMIKALIRARQRATDTHVSLVLVRPRRGFIQRLLDAA